MKTNKTSAVAIAAILAVMASLMLLVLNVTALVVIGYVFALFGIGLTLFSSLLFLERAKSHPWGAALPQAALGYLVVEILVSAVAIAMEQVLKAALAPGLFLVIHAGILAVFAIRLVLLNAGLPQIDQVEEEKRDKTARWKSIVQKMEALAMNRPELKPLLDEVRYSDPVSVLETEEQEEKIQWELAGLEQAVSSKADGVSELCAGIVRLVKERNRKLKGLK
jgi:signal transduction histidine kinase